MFGIDHWAWSCGFFPANHRGLSANETFDEARAAFETAWQRMLPQLTESDFAEHRRERAFDAWKRQMWASGCKLPTQVADGPSTCFCGAVIGTAEPRGGGAHDCDCIVKDHGNAVEGGNWPINLLELVGESMGLKQHDRYKELKMMQDADQIVADCADLVARHALDAAKAREVVVKGMLADQPLPLRGG